VDSFCSEDTRGQRCARGKAPHQAFFLRPGTHPKGSGVPPPQGGVPSNPPKTGVKTNIFPGPLDPKGPRGPPPGSPKGSLVGGSKRPKIRSNVSSQKACVCPQGRLAAREASFQRGAPAVEGLRVHVGGHRQRLDRPRGAAGGGGCVRTECEIHGTFFQSFLLII